MTYLNRSTKTDQQRFGRRRAVQLLGAGVCSIPAIDPLLSTPVDAADQQEPLNRFPRMVHEFFVTQVLRAEARNLRLKRNLKTKADAEAYVQLVRRKIQACFGAQPRRTPLKPRVTGIVERQTYKIEKVIFDSRPNFPVTANLYIPKGREFPLPGVVGTCGHSANGKATEAYQSFAQGLARLGYVCLIYDPIGQGERLQYVNDDLTPLLRPGTREHLHAGNQQFLVGDFFGMWRAWDGIRALDYLISREEVDDRHLGVTGNSGGGTMTTWLSGLEQRWTMVAPSCFVTTFRSNMENELPADTEQCPPRALALALDHDDFLAAQAPDPVIILAQEQDYFDARGTEHAYSRLRRLYKLLGADENIGLFIGPTFHGYTQHNREAMYAWFNKATKLTGMKQEPKIVIEDDKTLWCTENGQVAELKPQTVFDFTRSKSMRLAMRREVVEGEALKNQVRNVLKLPRVQLDVPEYRILRNLGSRGYPSPHAIAYAVETEAGIQALVYRLTEQRWHSRPPRGQSRAVLYVAHLSSDAELRNEPLIREVSEAESEAAVFTCDVRGIGESLPQTCGFDSFHSPYGCDYFYAIHSLMLDRPYVGQKTYDVLRVLQWLASIGHDDVHLVGKGWGALAATFAAVMSDQVTQITLKNALTSYTEVAESEHYTWPLSTLVPNILARFDLPDCYRALEAKELRQIEPWGATASFA